MQTITVDMTPGFRQPTIHYSQNDVGTTFAIDLRSRFGDTLPASPTVKIQATKPSGFGFSIEADSVVDSVATFTTVATMTDEAGRFQAELQIIKDAVVIYTANFYMEGEANPHPIGTTDGSQETIIPTLTLLVERVEAAAASVLDMTVEAETLAAGSQATYSYDEDTNTATFGIPQGEAGAGAAGVTASAYSSSRTYAVGDYVIHNSNLYRCTTAITTAEAFTAAHWTQVVLADDVSDVKSAINKQFVALSDAENHLKLNFFYEAEVNGTTKKAVPCNAIPSGTYTLSIDELVSSDTDESQCLIEATYSDDTYQYYLVDRGTDISVSVTFAKEVKRLTFYASTNEAKSSGDTFTYSKVKVYQFTEMKTRFENIDAEISATNDKIVLNNDVVIINNIITGRYISRAEGYEGWEMAATGSICTDFVYVRSNAKVRVVGCYLSSNRSICGYDHNRQFVSVLIGGTSETDVTITIPNNVEFIRITGKTDVELSATYVGVVGKYDNQPTFGTLTTENGYMISSAPGVEGRKITQSSSSCTDFIRVIPNTVIRITDCYVASYRSICCYDSNKDFVSVLITSRSSDTAFSLPIPSNARYIRITAHTDEAPTVVYLSKVLNEAVSPQYQKNASLFDNASKIPVLTFIDDDTYGTSYVTRQKNLCDSLGIKCSFACLTAQVESDSDLLDTLLGFEKDGFPIIFHGNTQGDFYNTPTLDVEAEEDDFVTGLHKMHEYGFADYKIWATPFGGSRDDEKKLAIKWGLLGLVTSGKSDINNPYLLNPESRWNIQRISLGSNTDTQSSDLTTKVAQIKSAIDDAVACNGWVCISTHSAYPVYRTGEADSAMSEVVTYALSKGMEIRTVNEQLRRWMPIYNYYEQY